MRNIVAGKILIKLRSFFLIVIITLLLLELILHICSYVISTDNSLFKSVKTKKIKIVVLGESTSYFGGKDSYPSILQDQLNTTFPNTFHVINLSSPAITTTQVKNNINRYIEIHKPQIALIMLGINDQSHQKKLNASPLINTQNVTNDFELKIFKLINYFFFMNGRKSFFHNDSTQVRLTYKQLRNIPQIPVESRYEIAKSYTNQEFQEVLTAYQHLNIVELSLKRFEVLFDSLLQTTDIKSIELALIKYSKLQISPVAMFGLLNISEASGYKNIQSCINLLRLISTKTPQKAIALDTVKDLLRGYIFYIQNSFLITANSKKIETLKIKVSNIINYTKAMRLLKDINKLKINMEKSKFDPSKYLTFDTKRMSLFASEKSKANYKYIVEKLEDSKVQTILIQYPLRSTESLYDIFGKSHPIISNKFNFLDALKKLHYEELFTDRFAHNFGHFSKMGATILSSAVLKYLRGSHKQKDFKKNKLQK
jgi:hypothetical protein